MKQPPPNSTSIDLADLGLALAFYGIITSVIAAVAAFLSELILAVFTNYETTQLKFYAILSVFWVLMNYRKITGLFRVKNSNVEIENKKNKVRIFESASVGFLWSYEAFYRFFPFEGNASPREIGDVFGVLIFILSCYRILTISAFSDLTTRNDIIILALMIITLIYKITLR